MRQRLLNRRAGASPPEYRPGKAAMHISVTCGDTSPCRGGGCAVRRRRRGAAHRLAGILPGRRPFPAWPVKRREVSCRMPLAAAHDSRFPTAYPQHKLSILPGGYNYESWRYWRWHHGPGHREGICTVRGLHRRPLRHQAGVGRERQGEDRQGLRAPGRQGQADPGEGGRHSGRHHPRPERGSVR